MNPIIEKLVLELNRVMFGEPWYGFSVQRILESVEPGIVFSKPAWGSHSIAEIALHILAWNEEIISRLKGNSHKEPEMGDWPPLKAKDENYWNKIKENIFTAHTKIISIVEELPIEMFEVKIGEEHIPELASGFNYRESLLGLMQHNIYHSGQIALLRIAINKH